MYPLRVSALTLGSDYHPPLDRLGLWPLPSETRGSLPPPPGFP